MNCGERKITPITMVVPIVRLTHIFRDKLCNKEISKSGHRLRCKRSDTAFLNTLELSRKVWVNLIFGTTIVNSYLTKASQEF